MVQFRNNEQRFQFFTFTIMGRMTAAFLREHAAIYELYEFVHRHGWEFVGQPLPKPHRHGRRAACFKNSALMSLKNDLIYVEGYASQSDEFHKPVLHAWCIDESGAVFDKTWRYAEDSSYFGIPIAREYVEKMHESAGFFGVLDLWELKWPILKEDPNVFLHDWAKSRTK